MTIGINGNEANIEHRVGVGQYAFELLTHLAALASRPDLKVYLSKPPLPDMPKVAYEVLPGGKLWTLTTLQKHLITEKKKPDIFFTPSHYAPFYLPMPSVISVMDLAFEKFPQYFKKKDLYQLRYWTRLSATQARKVLTISEFSKQEICKTYGFPSDKVVVTYPGYDVGRFNTKVKYKRGNYLLYLGTLQPRKNLVRLIEAFSLLPDKSLTLKITGMIHEGRGGWMYQEIFDKVKSLNLEKRIEFTGYMPDKAVPKLLGEALAYVLPSLYEGFGIPPIEAMAEGTPVVVSKTSSLPEICGEAPIYIDDPGSVESVRNALSLVLGQSPPERQKRIDFGLHWVKRYNWEDTAKKTLAVLRNELI